MKKIIAVLGQTQDDEKFLKYTKEFFDAYAKKIGVDIVYLNSTHGKYEIYNLLKDNKRVLAFDTDIIIREDCPDLFEIVPENRLGLFKESNFVGCNEDYFKAIQNYPEYKNILDKWTGQWYGKGVILASTVHRQLFKNPHFYKENNIPDEFYCINLRILHEKTKVYELHHKFNHQHFVDSRVGLNRFSSYIIHYHSPKMKDGSIAMMVYQTIEEDIKKIKSIKDYSIFDQRKLLIMVSAGMGDQLCAEPVIRYIVDKEYKGSDVTVASHWKKLFEHIENINLVDYDELKNNVPTDVLVLRTCPSEDMSDHHLSHQFFHPTDFAAFSTIKKTLPNRDKTIKLGLKIEDFTELIEIINIEKLKDLVLVHSGKWWPSKTFPVSWWQEVVDKLDEEGFVVGLIGKTIDDDQGYQPVNCPPNGVDFRDLISLGGLFCLISQAQILLTNDSSPLHIGGAFDNWIVTIPTCKHADHILPFRNGTQYYKTKTLNNGLLLDDLKNLVLDVDIDSIDKIPEGKDILDYLPTPDEVVESIKEIKEKISKNINY